MFIYRYWKIICTILITLIVLLFIIQKVNSRSRPLPQLGSLSEIKLEVTNVSQLQNLPTLYHQQPSGDNQKILFGQNAPQKYTEITAKNGTVIAIKKTNPKEFEFPLLEGYINKYGQTTQNIQTPWSEFGFVGYVYAATGKVIIAHPQSGEVVEEWIVPQNVKWEIIDQLFPPPTKVEGN